MTGQHAFTSRFRLVGVERERELIGGRGVSLSQGPPDGVT